MSEEEEMRKMVRLSICTRCLTILKYASAGAPGRVRLHVVVTQLRVFGWFLRGFMLFLHLSLLYP